MSVHLAVRHVLVCLERHLIAEVVGHGDRSTRGSRCRECNCARRALEAVARVYRRVAIKTHYA